MQDSTDFDIILPLSDSQVGEDLQLILGKLEEKRQKEIDESNSRLANEVAKLDLTDEVLSVLSGESDTPKIPLSIRQRVFNTVKTKLKRKNS